MLQFYNIIAMHSNKPVILFETEGSYPYSGGGISTWANILCGELEDEVDFIILALTGDPYVEQKYALTPNIKSVIEVPLWGLEEPIQHFNRKIPFSEHVIRKLQTDGQTIRRIFLPMFRNFISRIFDPFQPARESAELIYGFWKYYQHYDYKQTLSSPLIWSEFKNLLREKMHHDDEFLQDEKAHLLDVTFGKRWLYHFMMPLAVPLPRTSATHSTLAGFPAITSIAAKFEYGTPMILTDHGVFIRERLINVSQADLSYFSKRLLVNLATFITRAVYHCADLVSPVTSINAKWEKRFEADVNSIRPIYNGVDTDHFCPRPKPAHTQNIPTVVAAAHVFPLKDIETMIRSCDLVRREIPNVQYLLYGSLDIDKPYTEKCRQLVTELDLENHFTFGGYHDNPSMLFNKGDISILSSISEGFPYTVIESMSCGRPVVATDVGGVSEAIEGCGIVCKPRNANELAEGVIHLLSDKQFLELMAEEARKKVLQNYTIPQSVNSYLDVYQNFHKQNQESMLDAIKLESVNRMLESL